MIQSDPTTEQCDAACQRVVEHLVQHGNTRRSYACFGIDQGSVRHGSGVCIGGWPGLYIPTLPLLSMFHAISYGGNDRWVTWLSEQSPWARYFNNEPHIVNGHDIHSREFRCRYGFVWTREDLERIPQKIFFSINKALRLGWNEFTGSTKVFFDLVDGGMDDFMAFYMSRLFSVADTRHRYQCRKLSTGGGHSHISSDFSAVNSLFNEPHPVDETVLKRVERTKSLDYHGVDSELCKTFVGRWKPGPEYSQNIMTLSSGRSIYVNKYLEYDRFFVAPSTSQGFFTSKLDVEEAPTVDIKGLFKIAELEKERIKAYG